MIRIINLRDKNRYKIVVYIILYIKSVINYLYINILLNMGCTITSDKINIQKL